MRTIIAVENVARSPGSFEIAVRTAGGKSRTGIAAGRDASGAAAAAISMAISYGDAVIVAPGQVMQFIPAEFRANA